MDDFTKTKLINNLIDLVAYFYETKHKSNDASQIRYLKGFCEGISHTLVESEILTQEEAKRILKGLGKKRTVDPLIRNVSPAQARYESKVLKEKERDQMEDLDVPTIFRKKSAEKKS